MMVAMLIYAGLRREELLWLTHDDIDYKTGTYGMLRIRAKTVDGEYWQPHSPLYPRNHADGRAVPADLHLRGSSSISA